MPYVHLMVSSEKVLIDIPLETPCTSGQLGIPIYVDLLNLGGEPKLPQSDFYINFGVKEDPVHGDKALIEPGSERVHMS